MASSDAVFTFRVAANQSTVVKFRVDVSPSAEISKVTLLSEEEVSSSDGHHRNVSRRAGYKHALYKMWHLAYIDKNVFGQSKIKLSQHDVLNLCKECNKMPAPGVYVLPKDPTLPISLSNAVIVDKLQRKHLLALWRLSKDEDEYRRYIIMLTAAASNFRRDEPIIM
jgi:hypothetical protein